LFKQEQYEDAAEAFQSAATMAQNKTDKADALHNLGNAHVKNEAYDKAIDAYKQALRNNPSDEETRYNLARTQHQALL